MVALALPLGLAAPSGAYQRPGQTELVSVPLPGQVNPPQLPGQTYDCDPGTGAGAMNITPDGRYVAFTSYADKTPGPSAFCASAGASLVATSWRVDGEARAGRSRRLGELGLKRSIRSSSTVNDVGRWR